MITTTLNRIQIHYQEKEIWTKLLAYLGKTQADDEPLPYSTILDAIGLEETLWCCRAEPQHAREWRLYAVWCARQVQHLMSDPCSVAALDVAERHAHGKATDEELQAAYDAADDGTYPAFVAREAAGLPTPGYVAYAVYTMPYDAAEVAAEAADDAKAARSAAMAAQEAEFRRIVG